MRERIIELLDKLLAKPRKTDSGWAAVTPNDKKQLVELFQTIIETKFQPDADGDSSVEFFITNRNTHQRMHFRPLKYPSKNRSLAGAMSILNDASTNMALASNQLGQAVGHMDFEMRHRED